jgi:hypothetical protein
MKNSNADFFKDVLIGAVGGLIGTVVLERISSKLYEWEDEQARRRRMSCEKMAIRQCSLPGASPTMFCG